MTSCENTRKDRKRFKASRTKEEFCRKTVSQQKRRCGRVFVAFFDGFYDGIGR